MDVITTKDLTDTHGCVLEFGIASWQGKYPDQECLSVRARYLNANGGFSSASPEVAIEVVPEMMEFVSEIREAHLA
jgi:hypothetical protein